MKADDELAGTWWTNHYRCPECRNQWEDQWNSWVDDECGACGLGDISPYYSDDGSGSEEERLAQLARADAELARELATETVAAGARPPTGG